MNKTYILSNTWIRPHYQPSTYLRESSPRVQGIWFVLLLRIIGSYQILYIPQTLRHLGSCTCMWRKRQIISEATTLQRDKDLLSGPNGALHNTL